MTRPLFALLLLAAGCGTAAQPSRDGGVPFDRDAEPTRFCLSAADCYEGEECVEIRLPPTSVCRPGSSTDAGSNPTVDDAGTEPVDAADAGALPEVDGGSCWVSRNLNVNWTLVSVTMTGGTSSCAPPRAQPSGLVTTVRPPCDLAVGLTWDSTRYVAPCVREGSTDRCAAELSPSSLFTGASLFRMPVVGDTITQDYENCRATWRVQAVAEGMAW